MKITLRKANALQNSIQDHLKTIDVKTSISINEFQDHVAELACAREGVVKNDERRRSLTKALYDVRAQVGRANTEAGVADLLTQAAYVDKRIGHLKGLTESTATESDVVLVGKLDKMKSRTDSARSYYDKDSVDTGVLTAEQIAVFKSELSQLKKEKQTINDKVLELNVRTEIELAADVVNLLTQEGIV